MRAEACYRKVHYELICDIVHVWVVHVCHSTSLMWKCNRNLPAEWKQSLAPKTFDREWNLNINSYPGGSFIQYSIGMDSISLLKCIKVWFGDKDFTRATEFNLTFNLASLLGHAWRRAFGNETSSIDSMPVPATEFLLFSLSPALHYGNPYPRPVSHIA